MKRRTLLLLSFPLVLAGAFVAGRAVLERQQTRFEETFLADYREELDNRLDLAIQFFRPALEENDLDALDHYCDAFSFDERDVAIFNARGDAIVASDAADLRSPLSEPEVVAALKTGRGFSTRQDADGLWTARAAATLQSRQKTQIVRLVVPADELSSALRRTSSASDALLVVAAVATGFLVWYLLRRVAGPLDRLQRSAERIAAGDLSVEIAVPPVGPVRELAESMRATTERLKTEVDRARRQEKFRRDFVANVSHEIKTPLTGILGAIQLLDDADGWRSPVCLAKCREILERQTTRLQTLVRDVLQLAELERREELNEDAAVSNDAGVRETVPFDEIVRAAVRTCADSLTDGDATPRLLRCDAAQVVRVGRLLEQATLNLLTNAAKYGARSTAANADDEKNGNSTDKEDRNAHEVENAFDVSLEVADETVSLVVRDFGAGVPTELAERVFERFFRLRREYGRRPEGTGLGLPIVRQIATLHGGTVRCEPLDGPGARFVLTLPLAPPHPDETPDAPTETA
ncbi:MAG: HAMP domain-containing histidine kinase [Thermoguttaceae bacterium]|nr:HAMP domain-containing histidine kinase [Thermoguttaceae bacterium]